MMPKNIVTKQIEVLPDGILSIFSEAETAEIVDKWLIAFGKNRQGVNSKAYLWHIFCADRYVSLSGDKALTQYKQQVDCDEYIVLSNDRKMAFTTKSRPDYCAMSDYYVFPRNLAWTMAFTHEDGWLGPYFARHANFTLLNEENIRKLKKKKEAEAAKLKGWP
jgi:hypothetical protein